MKYNNNKSLILLLKLAIVVILTTTTTIHLCNAQFSSNVVTLTSRNWQKEVIDSAHGVFINICRNGWGYCQLLTPEWEKLASAVKGTIKIAHWDTQNSGQPPRLLGEIKGTPTIRFFKPKPKQKPIGSNKQKIVTDYNGERKGVDMKRWVDYMMPNYIEVIVNGLKDYENNFYSKASRNGLPQVLLFSSKDKTMPLSKFLSIEFRRKILLGEVKPSKINKDVMDKFNVTELPALIVIPLSSSNENKKNAESEEVSLSNYDDPVRYERKKEDFTRHKLHTFLSKYALKNIVIKKENNTTTTEKETKSKKKDKDSKRNSAKEEL